MPERCMCGDPECSVCGPLQGFTKPSLAELENQRREEEADLDEDLDLEDEDDEFEWNEEDDE